jgi:UDP-GlcNAc:undecaprenyl-phosphate GlcNAc-1-phosphate transferase
MEPFPLLYPGVLAAALGATLLLTPLALRFARRLGILDRPGGHKMHESPVPYLGGAAMVVAFAATVMLGALIVPPESAAAELAIILGIAVALSLVGLLDDLWGLGPWVRLAFEVGAGIALWAGGIRTQLFTDATLDFAVTVAWVVGVTNAFNLLDNMDGLSAGVAAIASGSFFLLAAFNDQFLVATLAIALGGCAVGFLQSNFHPARIYMGDAGSLFLGFMLAVIGIKLRFPGPTQVTFFVPILVLGVAIFDTVLVTVARLLHGRNPMSGGRDHTSHRLVFVGIPVPVAVTLIYAGAISLGWLALVMARVDRDTGFLLMGFVLFIALLLGVLLGLVPVYETSRRRRLMIQEVVEHEPEPEKVEAIG